jgi:hypothetical protein
MPDPLPTNIATVIETVLEDRLGGHGQFDGLKTEKAIIDACQRFIRSPVTSFVSPPTGEGVDIWLERGGIDYLFDTKTVYPNVGSYSKFLGQVVKWKAYFYSRFPTSKCQANIVFPYNPYGKIDFWSKTMNCGRPLDKNYDALVEDEFWDLLSGHKGTFEIIAESFIEMTRDKVLETEFDKLFSGRKIEVVKEARDTLDIDLGLN